MRSVNRYLIRRFYQDGRASVIVETGLTLEEAQAHCNDPSTKGGDSSEGTAWFDGYDEDPDADDDEPMFEVVGMIVVEVDEASRRYAPDEDALRGDR
jgi:hypothetical protein